MALELRQQLKLTQQLILTPQLQMSIKLLQLSRLELIEMISQQLEENPVLEEVQEAAGEEQSTELSEAEVTDIASTKELSIDENAQADIDWSNYIDEYNSPDKIHFETETVSPKQGRIKWRGIVHGDSIEVNYHWSKKGWLSNTEKDYLFQGTLKK